MKYNRFKPPNGLHFDDSEPAHLTKKNYEKQLAEPKKQVEKIMKKMGYNVVVKENAEKSFYFLSFTDKIQNGEIPEIIIQIEELSQEETLEALKELREI